MNVFVCFSSSFFLSTQYMQAGWAMDSNYKCIYLFIENGRLISITFNDYFSQHSFMIQVYHLNCNF